MFTLNTVATVGIQFTSHSIEEDYGTLTVCVRVTGEDTTCPIGFDFIVYLSTQDGSAGEMSIK